MTQPPFTPRLSKICLLTFIAAFAMFIYEWRIEGEYDLAFLVLGAIGCINLLLLGQEHQSAQQRYRSMPQRLSELRGKSPAMIVVRPPMPRAQVVPFAERRKTGRQDDPRPQLRRIATRAM